MARAVHLPLRIHIAVPRRLRIAVHGSLTILAIADDYTAPNRKLLAPYHFVPAIYPANWFDKNKTRYYHSEIPSKVVVEQSNIYR